MGSGYFFKIGVGPSSSHTVGPMRAGRAFILSAEKSGHLSQAARLQIDLYGSLALTGKGHSTDLAVLLGVQGEQPDLIDPNCIPSMMAEIRRNHQLELNGQYPIAFDEPNDLIFHYLESLPYHPNGMRFCLFDAQKKLLQSETYYSIGGGFIVSEKETNQKNQEKSAVPYPFSTGRELLAHCKKTRFSIAKIMLENEKAWHTEAEIKAWALKIWSVMKGCIDRGCAESGILPGGLKVKRRAHIVKEKLMEQEKAGLPRDEMSWINLYALAVNEENAAGGRVVTAPTNGAAGIIPAVLHYYLSFTPNANEAGIIDFLLTATAIGILFKEGASISAAEMGCQGEVGVACSMAGGALTEVWGGTAWQVENAAEMGIEHNLGLTCDPIGGLVQIPCIERNTMGSVQAVNCAKLALMGDGTHIVSLDDAIKAMKQTGEDMKDQYKETSKGGLAIAVNQPAC
ncbi:MAG: L-serine ammonia-lyase [Gammaproteobacteria bacterium]|nr:L-serine ammonia-lyase [Gammaproteobacteria bacterium]